MSRYRPNHTRGDLRCDSSGKRAENQFAQILSRENIAHRRASAHEDRNKIDFWIWSTKATCWVKLQLTIAVKLDVLIVKTRECEEKKIALLRLKREELALAASNRQGSMRARRAIVAAVFHVIEELLMICPEAASVNCQM